MRLGVGIDRNPRIFLLAPPWKKPCVSSRWATRKNLKPSCSKKSQTANELIFPTAPFRLASSTIRQMDALVRKAKNLDAFERQSNAHCFGTGRDGTG
jgi:hypothetical protein